jgi:hypothetical protein
LFLKPRRIELKTRAILLAVAVVLLVSTARGQDPQATDLRSLGLRSQPLRIVDLPTAGLLPRGAFRVEADVYSDGGLLLTLGVGFARYFNFGISYGGANVIGSDDPVMNPEPAVNLKARLIEETLVLPAVAIGFDSQGYGEYLDDEQRYGEKRYLVKSRGIFAVASKNWDLAGPLSLHGGMSYSLENERDEDPTIFIGLIKSFGGFLDIRAEYDFGYNDNEGECELIESRGYLNAAVVWHVNENFSLSFEVRDIASESRIECDGVEITDLREWNRGLSIIYQGIL